jgi:hypothetical protein
MLELQLKPQFSVVIPPRLLQEGYLVTFPNSWPSTYDYVSGKTFRLEVVIQNPYEVGYTIPTGDYRDIDFSNGTGTFQLGIYPENQITLYEIAIGWKPGPFINEFFIPATRSVNRLEYRGKEPDVSDSTLRFLGAYNWQDSPYKDPQIKFYAVKNLTPMIMRQYVLAGVDYWKCVTGFIINRCKMSEITNPTQDQLQKAKVIRYYEELKW